MNLNFKKMIFSNYLSLMIRFVVMIVLTRQMFTQLSHEAYGFWTLLWAIYAYSLLFDFGLGICIQKKSSQVIVNKDWNSLTQLISTVFVIYWLISLLLITLTYFLSLFIFDWFTFTSTSHLEYRNALLIFGIGSAIIFPFGIFAEVLKGSHLIAIRNKIEAFREFINASMIIACLFWGGGLVYLAMITITIQLLANFYMALKIKQHLPIPKLIDFSSVKFSLLRSHINFSLSVYGITIANLIIFRTDQIVISIFLSVSFVALYHVANRLSEIFKLIFNQIQDLLAPITSSLLENNNNDSVKNFLRQTQTNITLITLLFYFPLLILVEPLLNIWLDINDSRTFLIAKILLSNMAIQVIFRNTISQVLMMAGKHALIMRICVVEAFLNLLLSILLIDRLGIIGVALGTIIPNILLSLSLIMFLYKDYLKVSLLQIYKTFFYPIIITVIIYVAGIMVLMLCELNTQSLLISILHAVFQFMVCVIIFYLFLISDETKQMLLKQQSISIN